MSDPTDMNPQELRMFHANIYKLWLSMKNLPYAIRQQLGFQAESQSADNIDQMMQSAYGTINAQIQAAEQRDDANTASQVAQLKALKATVPYHYSLGQKDEQWLNDQINAIIGTPNVSNVSQANAIGNNAQAPPASWEDTTAQEVPSSAKPATQQA